MGGEARGSTPRDGLLSPRVAFETLFFEYMGLVPADLLIVRESEDEIVWESRNPCPTLEACRSLDLDTRAVLPGRVRENRRRLSYRASIRSCGFFAITRTSGHSRITAVSASCA